MSSMSSHWRRAYHSLESGSYADLLGGDKLQLLISFAIDTFRHVELVRRVIMRFLY
jgi:hypothetical protein